MDKKLFYKKYLFSSKKFNDLEKTGTFHKFVFFQNIRLFKIPSFYFESINPNHKFILYGQKEDTNNYEKIALLIRVTFFSYLIAFGILLLKVLITWI